MRRGSRSGEGQGRTQLADGSLSSPCSTPCPPLQLLIESIALNSTANIYTDRDGAAGLAWWAAPGGYRPTAGARRAASRARQPWAPVLACLRHDVPCRAAPAVDALVSRPGAPHRQQDGDCAAGAGAAAGRQPAQAAPPAAPAGAGARARRAAVAAGGVAQQAQLAAQRMLHGSRAPPHTPPTALHPGSQVAFSSERKRMTTAALPPATEAHPRCAPRLLRRLHCPRRSAAAQPPACDAPAAARWLLDCRAP